MLIKDFCLNCLYFENSKFQLEVPEGFEVMKVLPCARLEYNVSGVCYVIVSCPDDVAEWVGTISPTLKFIVKDCDPNTGEPDSNDG